jgi:hypothetical protein
LAAALKKTNRALLEEIHATHSATARILVARIDALTEENETLRRWLGRTLRRKPGKVTIKWR